MRATRTSYLQSLALNRQLAEKGMTPFNLEGLASLLARQGEFRWAVQLWGAAEALREAMPFPLPPADRVGYEQTVATARTQLGEEAFTAAWQDERQGGQAVMCLVRQEQGSGARVRKRGGSTHEAGHAKERRHRADRVYLAPQAVHRP